MLLSHKVVKRHVARGSALIELLLMFAAGSRASLTEPGPVYTASEEQ